MPLPISSFFIRHPDNIWYGVKIMSGRAVASWLTLYATNRQVAGSIPDYVIGIIQWQSCQSHYGPGVDSASNRNDYQVYFLALKAAGA